uniref:VOC domain-containing protein n=1 Tax=Kalanchoe fedtschenkoi TaxID=63787 RepID=A0A7N0U0W8_KALFE
MKYEAQEYNPLRITSLNHISIGCKSIDKSIDFYENVLGFFPVKRPRSFDFEGAWLFNYGVGIHLIQSEDPVNFPKVGHINPKDNHISFQCGSMEAVEAKLKQMGIEYVKGRVEEGGIHIDQVFFHDPDGTMIEICNCNVLPVVPLIASDKTIIDSSPCSNPNLESQQQQQQVHPSMTRTPSLVAIHS